MSEIGIIANPNSLQNRRDPSRQKGLAYILGEQGQMEVTPSLDAIDQVARKFKESGIKILAINGGDGTISQTLTRFIKVYGTTPLPSIVLLGGGNVNVLKSNIRQKGRPEKVLYRLVQAYSKANTPIQKKKIYTLEIMGRHGFLFSDGCSCTFLDTYYKKKNGFIGVQLLLLRYFFSWIFKGKTYKRDFYNQNTEIKFDQSTRKTDSIVNFCSTIETMPYGFRHFPLAKVHREKIQILSFEIHANKLPLLMPLAVFWRRGPKAYGSKHFEGKAVEIQYEKPGEFISLDGELLKLEDSFVRMKTGVELEFLIV